MAPEQQRIPPSAPDAEASVLGAMLVSPEARSAAIRLIGDRVDAFYDGEHQNIYNILRTMEDERIPIDAVTFRSVLEGHGLHDSKALDVAVAMTQSSPNPANVEFHARIVLRHYHARRLIRLAGELRDGAYDVAQVPSEVSTRLADALDEVSAEAQRDAQDDDMSLIEAAIKDRDGNTGIRLRTNYDELDSWSPTQIRTGRMLVIGGAPGEGKTTLALNLSVRFGSQGCNVLFVSLEMQRYEIARKLASIASTWCGVGSDWGNAMRTSERGRIESQLKPIEVVWFRKRMVTELLSAARSSVRQRDMKIVVVDFVQLLHSPGRWHSRAAEITDIVDRLMSFAREFDVLVVLLSQISREARKGQNENKLAWFKESGSIEEYAHYAWIVTREHFDGNMPEAITMTVYCVKNRDGEADAMAKLVFRPRLSLVESNNELSNMAPLPDLSEEDLEAAPF